MINKLLWTIRTAKSTYCTFKCPQDTPFIITHLYTQLIWKN